MLKLVKLPSLVAKYCKTWKIYACKVCKFCILLYYAYHEMAELPVNFGHFVVSVIQKCTKFANFASLGGLNMFLNPDAFKIRISHSAARYYSNLREVVQSFKFPRQQGYQIEVNFFRMHSSCARIVKTVEVYMFTETLFTLYRIRVVTASSSVIFSRHTGLETIKFHIVTIWFWYRVNGI